MHQELGLHSGDNLDFTLLGYDMCTVWFGRWYVRVLLRKRRRGSHGGVNLNCNILGCDIV
jgi:hypothetical protein